MAGNSTDALVHAPLYDQKYEIWNVDPVRAMHETVDTMLALADERPQLFRCVDSNACELGRLAWTAHTQPPETLGKIFITADGQRPQRPAKNGIDGSDIWLTVRGPNGSPNIQPKIDDVRPLEPGDRPDPRKPDPVRFHGDVIAACARIFEVCQDKPETINKHRYDESLVRFKEYHKVFDILLGLNRGHIESQIINTLGRRMLFKIEELARHVADPADRLYGGIVIDNSVPILDAPSR
jgi:hypothetical protein